MKTLSYVAHSAIAFSCVMTRGKLFSLVRTRGLDSKVVFKLESLNKI